MSERDFPPSMGDILTDWQGCREDVHREFDKAESSEQRGALLAILHATMDIVEKNLVAPDDLEKFRTARSQDYCLLLVTESRQGDDVNSEILFRVTKREVEAGRMQPDHQLRELALIGTTIGVGTTEKLGQTEQHKASKPWWKRLLRSGQAA